MQAHQHDVIYYGVVNLVEKGKIIGTIDVWRCRGCNDLFCEDKRFGATDLAPEVGFPSVEPGSKWAALICTRNNGSTWTLTAARPGATLVHACTPETKAELKVNSDYSLEQGPVGLHRIILIENFVNAAVDVETGRKHTGTTDAYQALGKPFSLTPPLSAAIAESSKLRFLDLTSLAFAASGLVALFGAFTQPVFDAKIVLAAITIASTSSAYFLFKKHAIGPIIGLGVGLSGLAVYNSVLLSSGNALGVFDYILIPIFVADLLLAWTARTRISILRKQGWHPLDMPAYG